MNSFFGKLTSINLFMMFSVAMLLAIVFAVYRPEQKHNISLQIDVDEQDISSLNDAHHTKLSTTQFYESLNFPSGRELRHASGRPAGFNKNFFITARSEFEVSNEDTYDISVNSDDGYRLFIDDKMVGEFIKDRPANNDKFQLLLKKGKHTLTMDYFQGFGNAALQVKYKPSHTNSYNYFGINSPEIKFIPFS